MKPGGNLGNYLIHGSQLLPDFQLALSEELLKYADDQVLYPEIQIPLVPGGAQALEFF